MPVAKVAAVTEGGGVEVAPAVGRVEARLHLALAARRLRLTPAARAAGVTKDSAISFSHDRLQRVDLSMLARWCAALGCGVDELLVYVAPPADVEREGAPAR